MLIGTMNHPERPILDEISWMASLGMDFIDLTLEPPAAASWDVDPSSIRRALDRYRMQVVGHTAWYLPMASAIEEIRRAAVAELARCIEIFGTLGVKWMNIHPDRHTPWHPRDFFIQQNLRSLRELLPVAERHRVGLMIENLPGDFNSPPQLGELLEPIPELGLHLDIGHANLRVPHNTTREILKAYGDRLRHVHLHDNRGGHEDSHLPLGAGNVAYVDGIQALYECRYDGTITLEVFTPDRHYLTYSRDVLRRTWDQIGEERARQELATLKT
jgi:sugar phosphate isomerase/epimerase